MNRRLPPLLDRHIRRILRESHELRRLRQLLGGFLRFVGGVQVGECAGGGDGGVAEAVAGELGYVFAYLEGAG